MLSFSIEANNARAAMTTMLFLIKSKQTRDFVDGSAGGQPFEWFCWAQYNFKRIPLTLSRVSSTFVDTSTQNFHILSRVTVFTSLLR